MRSVRSCVAVVYAQDHGFGVVGGFLFQKIEYINSYLGCFFTMLLIFCTNLVYMLACKKTDAYLYAQHAHFREGVVCGW